MKFVLLTVLMIMTSASAMADENSEIFSNFKQEYCQPNTAIPKELVDACQRANTFADLKSATEKFVSKCIDKDPSSVLKTMECNHQVSYIEIVQKSYFAGAKTNGCKKAGETASVKNASSGKR